MAAANFLQTFPGVLDPFQLSMECFRKAVVTVVILEHHSNLFISHSSEDAM
jgi:hypothetical protein